MLAPVGCSPRHDRPAINAPDYFLVLCKIRASAAQH
jgi:hypothetical protein